MYVSIPLLLIFYYSLNNEPFVASWNEVENRRDFFEKYAKRMNFDSQDAEKWYLQPMENILSFKVNSINNN